MVKINDTVKSVAFTIIMIFLSLAIFYLLSLTSPFRNLMESFRALCDSEISGCPPIK